MRMIEDNETAAGRQLRRTLVEGRNLATYSVVTRQLYDRCPPPEFPNYETVVQHLPSSGGWTELVVPLQKRFHKQEDSLAFHDALLKDFDAMLKVPEPPPKKAEHRPAPAAAAVAPKPPEPKA